MHDSIYATISASQPLDFHVFVIPMCSARTRGSGGSKNVSLQSKTLFKTWENVISNSKSA